MRVIIDVTLRQRVVARALRDAIVTRLRATPR